MSEKVVRAILDKVDEVAAKKEPVSITWYGGEPLLAKDLIFRMSKQMIETCSRHGSSYKAYMISNGYLLTEEIVEKMKEAKITGVQITVDGPPDIHNMRRKLKNSSSPTFEKIIDNIKLLRKHDISVGIRINIDKTNVERLEEVLDIFIEHGLKDCNVNLGHVKAYTESCASICSSCLSTKEYADESLKYQELLYKKGFESVFYPYYPGVKANYCCADSITSYVIDPEGYMYKCWNDIGRQEFSVGNILKEVEGTNQMMMNHINYLLWSPFKHEKCRECPVLPLCMGGCPYNGIKFLHSPECEKWKYNLIDVLKRTYRQRVESK